MTIPLLLLIVLGVVVVAEIPEEAGLSTDVQARLDQYIAYSYPAETVTVQAVERARRPWHFDEEMSGIAFGDSVYFQTDTGPTRTQRLNLSPLYYPPKEVWCVLLQRESHDTRSYATVFVGLHMDMYNGDWVVHEGPADLSSPALMEALDRIRCDLGLRQVGPFNADGSSERP